MNEEERTAYKQAYRELHKEEIAVKARACHQNRKREEFNRTFGEEGFSDFFGNRPRFHGSWFWKIPDYVFKYEKNAYVKLQEDRKGYKKKKARETSNKGGKGYKRMLERQRSGLSGVKHQIRAEDGRLYRKYKRVIDPWGLSQLHHEWIPETSRYRGVALVEADSHMAGFIDVIRVLRGKITLLTEAEVRKGGKGK